MGVAYSAGVLLPRNRGGDTEGVGVGVWVEVVVVLELLHKRAAWVLMAWVLLHELLVLLY